MGMKISIAFFVTTLLLFSCKKDFLQKDTGVEISNDDVFSSQLYTTSFANNSYNFLIDDFAYFTSGNTGNTSELTDESIDSQNLLAVNLINQGALLNPNAGDMASVYTRLYKGIYNVNTFFANYNRAKWASVNTLNLIRGEQYFLRAFMYFELWKRWGDVILLDHPLGLNENQDLPRSPRDSVQAFIQRDLDSAMTLLPLVRTTNDYGRATKCAALALDSRMLLYAASPRFNENNDITLWQRALDSTKSLISLNVTNNLFTLEPNYANILTTSASKEYVLIKVRPPRSFSNGTFLWNFIVGGNAGAIGTFNPTQNHAEMYQMSNGLPITDKRSGFDSANPYVKRDPRFYNNLIFNGMTWQSKTIKMWDASTGTDYNSANYWYTRTRYYCRKLWPEVYKQGGSGTSLLNFVFFRWGEILLNYAEALNEVTGNSATVVSTMNQIRTRAGMPGVSIRATQDSMRILIHNERAVELAFEEHRWWDILRWKQGPQIVAQPMKAMNVANQSPPYGYSVIVLPDRYQKVFNENMYWYPIPLSEIQKSNGILKQTVGW